VTCIVDPCGPSDLAGMLAIDNFLPQKPQNNFVDVKIISISEEYAPSTFYTLMCFYFKLQDLQDLSL